MATAWIKIFILTFAECVAPAGKSVCQEQQFELQFVSHADCEYALEQLIAMKGEADHVIVNRQKSGCVPSAVESTTFESLDAINEEYKDATDWRVPGAGAGEARRTAVNKDHGERLDDLMSCEETGGVVPCKIGDIIVEEATGDSVEVWKQD
jgi:hypothetical protein